MIAEISAAIGAVQSVNSAIQALKEAKGHGGDLSQVIGRWANATEKARDAEKKGAGKMSYQEALKMESITRQLQNFDRQLQDICLMQGQGDLYNSIKRRMEESRLAHEKEVAKIRMQRRQFKENMKLVGIIFGWGAFCVGLLVSGLYLYTSM